MRLCEGWLTREELRDYQTGNRWEEKMSKTVEKLIKHREDYLRRMDMKSLYKFM